MFWVSFEIEISFSKRDSLYYFQHLVVLVVLVVEGKLSWEGRTGHEQLKCDLLIMKFYYKREGGVSRNSLAKQRNNEAAVFGICSREGQLRTGEVKVLGQQDQVICYILDCPSQVGVRSNGLSFSGQFCFRIIRIFAQF